MNAPIPPDNHDWKAEYLRQVDLHNQTLDELREAEMQLRNPAPIPPTIPDGWQLVPKVGTQGCMPCSDGDKPPHDAEPVKDDEWVQCYLYTLLDEAKRRGGMFPQTSDEQNGDSKAICRVADMVRFYGQQGYPKQDAIAKLQAIRASNFSQQGRRN